MENMRFDEKLTIDHLTIRPFAGCALCGHIAFRPVRIGKTCSADAFTARRVGKLAATHIESHVRNAAARRIEEDEIAYAEIGFRYGCTLLGLACSRARQINAEFLEDISGKSGTIET